jgi:hypothetical protein
MVKTSETLSTTVTFAVLARVFGIVRAERFEMSIEHVNPGEYSPTLASVRLMLKFLSMAKEISFRSKRGLASETVEWLGCLDTAMAWDVRSQLMCISFFITDEIFVTSDDFAGPNEMSSVLRMPSFGIVLGNYLSTFIRFIIFSFHSQRRMCALKSTTTLTWNRQQLM